MSSNHAMRPSRHRSRCLARFAFLSQRLLPEGFRPPGGKCACDQYILNIDHQVGLEHLQARADDRPLGGHCSAGMNMKGSSMKSLGTELRYALHVGRSYCSEAVLECY